MGVGWQGRDRAGLEQDDLAVGHSPLHILGLAKERFQFLAQPRQIGHLGGGDGLLLAAGGFDCHFGGAAGDWSRHHLLVAQGHLFDASAGLVHDDLVGIYPAGNQRFAQPPSGVDHQFVCRRRSCGLTVNSTPAAVAGAINLHDHGQADVCWLDALAQAVGQGACVPEAGPALLDRCQHASLPRTLR